MQIRSGANRVLTEHRFVPDERDAGRQAIWSIEDSHARLKPIKFSHRGRHCYRCRVIAGGTRLSDIYYRAPYPRCRYGAVRSCVSSDAFQPARSRAKLQGAPPLRRVFLSLKDYLNLPCTAEHFRPFPLSHCGGIIRRVLCFQDRRATRSESAIEPATARTNCHDD